MTPISAQQMCQLVPFRSTPISFFHRAYQLLRPRAVPLWAIPLRGVIAEVGTANCVERAECRSAMGTAQSRPRRQSVPASVSRFGAPERGSTRAHISSKSKIDPMTWVWSEIPVKCLDLCQFRTSTTSRGRHILRPGRKRPGRQICDSTGKGPAIRSYRSR
jgi:hypothetical protein